ncbi:exodeoxyribonuclease VII large subunit [Fructilactobacillus fructivorans]|uniref:exodeoxyribonuclease VII large subunit n=1 Tax=Fructilactobacillus fructivorans TaxID=1614 RepID=UPI0007055F8A|nr:exodeoxyribonuclease VII large subunit [Fructilactobacillus fructivorans]
MASKYLTVSALTQYIKKKFDVDPYLGRVYLTGEISNFRLRPTHQYFSLKDDNSKINVTMFKSAFSKIKFMPEEGMKVLVTGHVSVYEKTGMYQFYIDHMEPDGVGQLYEAYEQLKNKLAKEGLFEGIHKKSLTMYPKKIAVVTSQSGAVIKDIITTVRRRFPIAQIVLFPAAVQGENAASEIAHQIRRVNEIGGFDTLIIGRGGGSIEDLWPFNEEIVARAIYDSEVPVISSVGHETDTTIADLVSDQRAATPTAAAELAVPVLSDVLLDLKTKQTRIYNAMDNLLARSRSEYDRVMNSYVFNQPERLYESYVQQLDTLNTKLSTSMKDLINYYHNQLQGESEQLKLSSPVHKISGMQNQVNYYLASIKKSVQGIVDGKRNQLSSNASALDHLSPLRLMSSGYSMVTDSGGRMVKSIRDLKKNEQIDVRFSDGSAKATVDRTESKGDNK